MYCIYVCIYIGVDLAGILGRLMASAEGGLVPSGMRYGRGALPSRLWVWERRDRAPQRGPRGRAPAGNGFWCILKAAERFFLYLYDKIWGREQFALASPHSKFWGTCPPSPRDLRPCVFISVCMYHGVVADENSTE